MITYPNTIKFNVDKLLAIYSLREQERKVYNDFGALAKTDTERYIESGAWKKFRGLYREADRPLKIEYIRLKGNIQKAKYSIQDWQTIMDTPPDEKIFEDMYGNRQQLKVLSTKATFDGLEALKRINLSSLSSPLIDPYQDWTGYVETDAGGKLTVAANQIDFTDMVRNSNCDVTKDFTAGHFTTWSHDFQFIVTEWAFYTTIHMVSNSANARFATDPIYCAYVYQTGGNRIRIMVDDGAVDTLDTYTGSTSTNYYNDFIKDADSLDMGIYSDAAKTNQLDLLTVAIGVSTLRYLGNAGSYDATSGTSENSGSIYNLDINEAVGWANIAKYMGVAAAGISKCNSIAVASVAKLKGVAV